MNMIHKYPTTIQEAAILLDTVVSNWWTKINCNKLNMNNGNDCVLGQIYGGYYTGVRLLFNQPASTVDNCPSNHYPSDKIFGTNALVQPWINEVYSRKNRTIFKNMENVGEPGFVNKVVEIHDYGWAMSQLQAGKKIICGDWIVTDGRWYWVYEKNNQAIYDSNKKIKTLQSITRREFESKNWKTLELKLSQVAQGCKIKFFEDWYNGINTKDYYMKLTPSILEKQQGIAATVVNLNTGFRTDWYNPPKSTDPEIILIDKKITIKGVKE